jgi:hypothetical protein
MADDPDATYFLWDHFPLQYGGGGKTCRSRQPDFDIYIDIDYHLTTEGTACTNPRGSGSLQSLLAHELGHAWAWRRYGPEKGEDCNNNSIGNKTSVAWENTQLKGGARRVAHTPPGCPCYEPIE